MAEVATGTVLQYSHKAMQGQASTVKSGHSNGPAISHQNLHLSHNLLPSTTSYPNEMLTLYENAKVKYSIWDFKWQ